MNETIVSSESRTIYHVCIPYSKHTYFDYLANSTALIGARVWVPVKNTLRLGIIVHQSIDTTPTRNLKTIHEVIDEIPVITAEILRLCQWIARYYQVPLSEALPLALPKKLRLGKFVELPYTLTYHLAHPLAELVARTSNRQLKQKKLLTLFDNDEMCLAESVLIEAGFSKNERRVLEEKQIITHSARINTSEYQSVNNDIPLTLNVEQAAVLHHMQQHLDHYHCLLLQGITGSGKTEVYLQLIETVLTANKQVLILVPEIGLTPQLLSRFRARFTQPMAIVHSQLGETKRAIIWQLAKERHIQLVIGTRMALFTPLPNLGLIIIDEEHDASFKQVEGLHYSARDCALMRAYLANIPILLGSATPSLESLHNVNEKKYTRMRLTQKAISHTPLHYHITDLRNNKQIEGFAPSTLTAIKTQLEKGHQVLIFINRRGFSPVLLCHACGFMVDCDGCDTHLTLHQSINRLLCHHCGASKPIPDRCKHCNSCDFSPVGIGTQRVEAFLKQAFPEVKQLRVDRDLVQKKHEMDACLSLIHNNSVQLIVGTQMLAKGHHFPNLTLVVVVDADSGLYNQDFRALEHLGQLLTQVAGRAGRATHEGQVIIQTHMPNHPLLNLLIQQGYDAFAHELLHARQAAQLPPYHYLAIIRAQAKEKSHACDFLTAIKLYTAGDNVRVLGPAPAPLARKANQYHLQLLLKSSSRAHLQATLKAIREWLLINKKGKKVRWSIDVDPLTLA